MRGTKTGLTVNNISACNFMNLIDKSEAVYRNKCRREMTNHSIKKRITKKDIIREIRSRYSEAICKIEKTALGRGVIHIECNHGNCDRIGQFVFRTFPEQVHTYFSCHIFRKGRLTIYFKR